MESGPEPQPQPLEYLYAYALSINQTSQWHVKIEIATYPH
jgi:hypothetical protein